MTLFAKLGLAAGLTLAASASQALTISEALGACDPSDAAFFGAHMLSCGTSADRQDVDNVNLGAADGKFFSLGIDEQGQYGGVAIFKVAPNFTGPASAVEVTNPSKHWEAAAIYVANSLDELEAKYLSDDWVGIVDNGKGGTTVANTTVAFAGSFTYIMFEDVSYYVYGDAASGNMTLDGYDLDSFTVQPVPLPAAVLMLGAAVAGLGALRRRA